MDIEWTGDLTDDCTCRVPFPSGGTLVGRAELLRVDKLKSRYPDERHLSMRPIECWYCAVYRIDATGNTVETLFHSDEQGHPYCTGAQARAICEAIIKARLSA